MSDYAQHYAKAVGQYGTPSWNPQPHPEAAPDAVAKRDSSPLWGYHRGLIGYSGYPIRGWQEQMMEGKPNGYHAILSTQVRPDKPQPGSYLGEKYGLDEVDHTATIPEGFITLAEYNDHRDRGQRNQDADYRLTENLYPIRHNPAQAVPLAPLGALDAHHPDNEPRHNQLWEHGGTGRRPWYDTLFPLQDMLSHAAPHDAYRLLGAAVRSGNRHALPPLVDLLRKRDNPAGWYKGWTTLAKAMHERIGDLPVEDVLRRGRAIASATGRHSLDPRSHQAITEAAHSSDDLTPLAALADHMDEHGLPSYAQLLRAELANVNEGFRWTPKRKGGRL